jgi:hypothetical protein
VAYLDGGGARHGAKAANSNVINAQTRSKISEIIMASINGVTA